MDTSDSELMAEEIDRLCDEFERAWRENRQVPIEQVVAGAPAKLQDALCAELIAVEVTLRRETGQSPSATEFHARFPTQRPAVDKAFSLADATLSVDLAAPGNTGSSRRAESLLRAGSLPKIEGFEIQSEIHRGGQGIVFKAIQLSTKRIVALKVLLTGQYAGESERRRFEREIDLTASLSHRNLVTLYESGRTPEGLDYLVMEYVEGPTLDKYLKAQSALSLDEILGLFLKICDAVGYAHQKGVIHRDLKPGNILVDSAGEPRILDFGLARPIDRQHLGEDLTLTGQFLGTIAYASPEQVSGDPDRVDIRSDVYSLGVVLHKMLTGGYPYAVIGQLADVLKAIAEQEPETPSSTSRRRREGGEMVNPPLKLDRLVDAIVLKSLRKDVRDRYQSSAAMSDDIRRYLSGEPLLVAQPQSFGQLAVIWRWCQRNPAVSGLAATLGIVLIVGTVVSAALAISARRSELAAIREMTRADTSAAEAERERDNAEQRREENAEQLAVLRIDRGVRDCEAGHFANGLHDLLRAYEALPKGSDLRKSALRLLSSWSAEAPVRLATDKTLDAVAYAPDGLSLATAQEGIVRMWDVATGFQQAELFREDGISYLEFSRDGERLIAAVGTNPPGRGGDPNAPPGVYSKLVVWNMTERARAKPIEFSPLVDQVVAGNDGMSVHTLRTPEKEPIHEIWTLANGERAKVGKDVEFPKYRGWRLSDGRPVFKSEALRTASLVGDFVLDMDYGTAISPAGHATVDSSGTIVSNPGTRCRIALEENQSSGAEIAVKTDALRRLEEENFGTIEFTSSDKKTVVLIGAGWRVVDLETGESLIHRTCGSMPGFHGWRKDGHPWLELYNTWASPDVVIDREYGLAKVSKDSRIAILSNSLGTKHKAWDLWNDIELPALPEIAQDEPFDLDDETLAILQRNGQVILWNCKVGERVFTFGPVANANNVHFVNSEYLFVSMDNGGHLLDLKGRRVLSAAPAIIDCHFVHQRKQALFSTTDNSTLVLWDLDAKTEIKRLDSAMRGMAFGSNLAIAGKSNTQLIDWNNGETIAIINDTEIVGSAENDGRVLRIRTAEGGGAEKEYFDKLIRIDDGTSIAIPFERKTSRLKDITWLKSLTASLMSDGTFRVCDEKWNVIHGPVAGVARFRASADGGTIVLESADSTNHVLRLDSRNSRKISYRHGTNYCANLSPDGRFALHFDYASSYVVAVSPFRVIASMGPACDLGPTGNDFISMAKGADLPNTWIDVSTGKVVLNNFSKWAFSPAGNLLMTNDPRGTASIWDTRAKKKVLTLNQASPVTSMSFSADGRFVVTACDDGTTQAWNTGSGKPVGDRIYFSRATSGVEIEKDCVAVQLVRSIVEPQPGLSDAVTQGSRFHIPNPWLETFVRDGITGKPLGPARPENPGFRPLGIATRNGRLILGPTARDKARRFEHLLVDSPSRVRAWIEYQTGITSTPDEMTTLSFEERMARVSQVRASDELVNTLRRNAVASMKGSHVFVIRLAEDQRDWLRACYHLECLIAAHPADGDLRLRLASCHLKGGNWAGADLVYRTAVEAGIDTDRILIAWGFAAADGGHMDRYREICKRVFDRLADSNDSATHATAALLASLSPKSGLDPKAIVTVAAKGNDKLALAAALYRSERFEESYSLLPGAGDVLTDILAILCELRAPAIDTNDRAFSPSQNTLEFVQRKLEAIEKRASISGFSHYDQMHRNEFGSQDEDDEHFMRVIIMFNLLCEELDAARTEKR